MMKPIHVSRAAITLISDVTWIHPRRRVGSLRVNLLKFAERMRYRRECKPRPRSESRISRVSLVRTHMDYPSDSQRPRTRSECGTERPCPFVSCSQHLYLDVNERTGSIKYNFPLLEPDELTETCALDVAERGPATLLVVGNATGLTRERIRQIEASALRKLKISAPHARAHL